ncbi:PID-CTERM protein-sorting domain-containing protein [Pedobacter sp.]|uniref:PID-CTERM protein-sorting domain-containing protein n=1 Tax=Pedobacter sp. TaxID=1411316 RepID=UPI003D7F6D8D
MKLFLVLLILITLPVFANGPGTPGGDPDEPVPIDGGMYLLMAAGILYGMKSIKKMK